MIIIQQIIKAWELHNDAMLLTLVNIPHEAFELPVTGEGGRTVKEQILQMYKTRLENLQQIKKSKSINPPKDLENIEMDSLKSAFVDTGNYLEKAVAEALRTRQDKIEILVTGLVNSISSLIRNEARLRRNILSEINNAGFKLNNRIKLEI